MHLSALKVHQFRNLADIHLSPAPTLNFLYGANGSGKTSLLEAIHYLSLAKSFRTRHNQHIIQHQTDAFTLFGQLHDGEHTTPIGMERSNKGELKIRLAGETIPSIVSLTQLLPIQLLTPDSRSLLTGSSKLRRQYLDWGVFHVEPSFLEHWQRTQRLLKQRNAGLRLPTRKDLLQLWDQDLAQTVHILDLLRRSYIEKLANVFIPMGQGFLQGKYTLSLRYKAGWDETTGLAQTLAQSLARDLQLGYTQYGPQRADLVVKVDGNLAAHEVLSQGQQKLVVYALRLAQGSLLYQLSGKNCIYLLDDFTAELDQHSREQVMSLLTSMNAQIFITSVDEQALQCLGHAADAQMFHVEHGNITHSIHVSM
ncbi:MAG: DNA replication/repair protein RecF [Gammaproteobacteria bacterium]